MGLTLEEPSHTPSPRVPTRKEKPVWSAGKFNKACRCLRSICLRKLKKDLGLGKINEVVIRLSVKPFRGLLSLTCHFPCPNLSEVPLISLRRRAFLFFFPSFAIAPNLRFYLYPCLEILSDFGEGPLRFSFSRPHVPWGGLRLRSTPKSTVYSEVYWWTSPTVQML